jgi:ATP-dependent DNA helicase RecG
MPRSFRHPVLLQRVDSLRGVASRRGELLANLGIKTIGDLLFHFPRSFDDLSNVTQIDAILAGEMQTIIGEVVELESKELADGRRVMQVVISDGKGRVVAGTWFNVCPRQFRYGQRVAFSGKPKWFRNHWSIQHPRVEILEPTEAGPNQNVIPIYPLTENLRAEDLRDALRQALALAAEHVVEVLPASMLEKRKFPGVSQALWQMHFPEVVAQALQAKRRFIYEEFLTLQVALAARRRDLRDRQPAPLLPVDAVIDAHIRKLFPFNLTGDQDRAIRVICKDLGSAKPMQRLLQADVGAGKTAVAVYAMLVAVANKHQVALMAPTEVLARQHWQTIDRMLEKSRVRRLLLTGGLPAREREAALVAIRDGAVDLVVGTQALVQDDVRFAKLGLVVIDEQHKFGVHQRARIRKLGGQAHYLVMTATPIPRTIALTVFGDLDVSVLRELPPGRQPVKTRWHSEAERERIEEDIRKRLREGRQAFVVCPLVEESETLDLKAAEGVFAQLRDGPFKEFRVGLLHGQQSADDKERSMADFRDGKVDLLVATLVIEVGIDIPNATVMLIEHAERFGLSQLHQLRGRVSRGLSPGECHLFTGSITDDAKERLKIFTRTGDGFKLAEEDARLRGLGEFFGSRQHGLGDLEIGDLLHDRELLDTARTDAWDLILADPGLKSPEHAALRAAVLERYGQTLDLAEIG